MQTVSKALFWTFLGIALGLEFAFSLMPIAGLIAILFIIGLFVFMQRYLTRKTVLKIILIWSTVSFLWTFQTPYPVMVNGEIQGFLQLPTEVSMLFSFTIMWLAIVGISSLSFLVYALDKKIKFTRMVILN